MTKRSNWVKTIGLVAVLISLSTWALDYFEWIYHCPYCRTQRSAIGVIGLIMLSPWPHHWCSKWFSLALGTLGIVVASMQNFNHQKNIYAGTFELGENFYLHPFLLSGAAVFILSGQLMLIFSRRHEQAVA
jgi:disulfide bond formation protein DsbB